MYRRVRREATPQERASPAWTAEVIRFSEDSDQDISIIVCKYGHVDLTIACLKSIADQSAIDELADELGIDPINLRIKNEPEKDPTTLPFSSRHIVEAWRAGADKFGCTKRSAKPGATQDGEWLVGMGCATATYPYYRMPGGAARITLSRDGRAKPKLKLPRMRWAWAPQPRRRLSALNG